MRYLQDFILVSARGKGSVTPMYSREIGVNLPASMKILMHSKPLVSAFFLFILFCSGSETRLPEKGDPDYEGWAGSPENPLQEPYNFFYMKMAARASEAAIKTKNREKINASCLKNIVEQKKIEIVSKVASEARFAVFPAEGVTEMEIPQYRTFVRELDQSLREVHLKNCKQGPTTDLTISQTECTCYINARFFGGEDAVVKRLEELTH